MRRFYQTILIFLVVFALSAFAQIPTNINFQGVLNDANGDPVPDGNYSILFRLYESPTLPTSIWSETQATAVNDGIFNVVLGTTNPLNLPFDKPYYLGIKVETDPEMTPRVLFTATPYSLNARTVADGAVTTSKIADNAVTTTKVANNAITAAKVQPDVISSLSGVSNDGGNIDLVAGSNITITPNNPGNSITISSTGGGVTGSGTTNYLPRFTGPTTLGNSEIFQSGANIGIGTTTINSEAKLHLSLPVSGNFAHLRIQSPSSQVGFGILFDQPSQQWFVGQNIGNWNDGRFQLAASGSNNWLTLLSNGNLGLTASGFTTPFARFQVPQLGSMNNGGSLDVTKAAVYLGKGASAGMAFDEERIESVGHSLNINSLSAQNISLADGGGKVGVQLQTPLTPFHIRENATVLWGLDTVGVGFNPQPKLMWLPHKGGAFRVGQLNTDGSVGNGTVFWDPANVGWASVAIGNNTKASGAGSVALGIRGEASNFGSVAIGHLSRTRGNSAIAAGYYARADAFLSVAVGPGNVGGGNANSWIATDPIFEVGNSLDTTNRSNAFTILKNARVGINHANPQSMLDIEQPNQGPGNGVLLNLQGIGHWETGVDNAADYNFYFNNNLKAYILDTDGTYIKTSDRKLKRDIRPLQPVLQKVLRLQPSTYQYNDNQYSDPRSIGFIAQEVENEFPELVTEKEHVKGLKYDAFGVIAIKAIQEQQELIEKQRQIIRELQQTVATLGRRVSQLESGK